MKKLKIAGLYLLMMIIVAIGSAIVGIGAGLTVYFVYRALFRCFCIRSKLKLALMAIGVTTISIAYTELGIKWLKKVTTKIIRLMEDMKKLERA